MRCIFLAYSALLIYNETEADLKGSCYEREYYRSRTYLHRHYPVFFHKYHYQKIGDLLEPGKLIHMDPADVHTGRSVANPCFRAEYVRSGTGAGTPVSLHF